MAHDRCLVPLLDGLDELSPSRQEACVRAINKFRQDYRPKHVIVCCRFAEYENFTIKLQLETFEKFVRRVAPKG